MMEPKDLMAVKEDEISMQIFDFINFVNKDNYKVLIFLVEFEYDNLVKSYYIQESKVRFGITCEV